MGRELRRVPLDFNWPMKEIWPGFVNPYGKFRRQCPACGGSGYAPEAKRFHDQWYGYAPFNPVDYGATLVAIDHPRIVAIATGNLESDPDFYGVPVYGRDASLRLEVERLTDLFRGQWCHHLIQADVDALVAAGHLKEFGPAPPTAADVNYQSLSSPGGPPGEHVCIVARCGREGVPVECPGCKGEGDLWPGPEFEAMHEAWEQVPVPAGDGYQMWEDTTEGSPMSPVFATAEELARWLADTGASSCGSMTATYEQWLGMIRGPGWAMDLVRRGDDVKSGVAFVSEKGADGDG